MNITTISKSYAKKLHNEKNASIMLINKINNHYMEISPCDDFDKSYKKFMRNNGDDFAIITFA